MHLGDYSPRRSCSETLYTLTSFICNLHGSKLSTLKLWHKRWTSTVSQLNLNFKFLLQPLVSYKSCQSVSNVSWCDKLTTLGSLQKWEKIWAHWQQRWLWQSKTQQISDGRYMNVLKNPNEYKLELCEVRVFISIQKSFINQSWRVTCFFFITAHGMWLMETTIFETGPVLNRRTLAGSRENSLQCNTAGDCTQWKYVWHISMDPPNIMERIHAWT